MAKTIALIIVVFISTGPVLAQRRPVGDWKDSVRMYRSRPSVYSEFVEAGVCCPSETSTVESWSPNPVVLTGTIRRRTYAGPPNYESVAKGDLPERIWVLHLDQPICVPATAEWNREENISELQLVFENQKQYRKYRSLVDRQVSVSGTLFHATTGHHHTKVLLTVSRIQKRQ